MEFYCVDTLFSTSLSCCSERENSSSDIPKHSLLQDPEHALLSRKQENFPTISS